MASRARTLNNRMTPSRNHRVPKATVELALKWIRQESKTSEVMKRLGVNSVNQTIYTMGVALRQAYQDGILKEKL